MKKSNEQLARDVLFEYQHGTDMHFNLENEIKKALDIATGITPEVKFKFGDPVIDCDGNKGIVCKVLNEKYVVTYEHSDSTIMFWSELSHNLDFGNVLKFIKHDGSNKCPHDLRLKSIRFYKSGLSAIGEATSNGWDVVKMYAVIPEGWLE